MNASFTGNGAYCYANTLHMTLLAAGGVSAAVPEPGFLECATVMPPRNTNAHGRGSASVASDPSATGWSP